jgi:hypothetical protein
MSTNNKIIYIQPNYIDPTDTSTTTAIRNLVISLDEQRNNLSNNYNDKLVEVQNEFYNHRLDDEKLNAELSNELMKQIEYDNTEYQKLNLQKTQNIQKAVELSNDVNKLKKNLMTNVKTYNNIKSLNGQDLSIRNIRKTNDYMININNKCLSTDLNNNYSVENCNMNNKSQRFTINPVIDNNSYYSQYNFKPQMSEIRSYPYNLIKSKMNGLCLEEDNGKLFINKCESLNGQKWRGMHINSKSQKCSK